jgi:hypothetical protein
MLDREILSNSGSKIASEVPESQPTASRNIGLFLVLTALLSSIFYAFIIATGHVGGGNGTYELGLMWSPAIAALLTCRLRGLSLQSLGWRWGMWRWQWLAFSIPLGVYGSGLCFGDSPENRHKSTPRLAIIFELGSSIKVELHRQSKATD